ncbi:hypothetical protein [Neobacillus terrae]|uniref:hypothetical protein n=1 Tax=Neobacillus terrae TaxID=3034837 RepID=UPI00140D4846|nr:hypothetical protein [Neobacillus terrae]NHM31376.1 hypothetical protein [Neobacillus terrae]
MEGASLGPQIIGRFVQGEDVVMYVDKHTRHSNFRHTEQAPSHFPERHHDGFSYSLDNILKLPYAL